MKKGYEIIAETQDAFRGLPVKLARLTNKSDTYFRNQGQPPRTENAANCGVNSPVADFMAYCEINEGAMLGAGSMLASRTHNELMDRFAERNLDTRSEADIHVDIIDQTSDVDRWLAKFDFHKAENRDLRNFEDECDQAIEAIHNAKSRARVMRVGLNLITTNRARSAVE